MKTKLIGVLICVMLMTTLLTVAKPSEKIESKSSTEIMSTAYDADVPVWEVGDQWIYKIDNISIYNQTEDKTLNLILTITELPLIVVNTTTDFYTLTFKTNVSGQFKIYSKQDNGSINISITFTNIFLSGNVIIEKSTLGIKEISAAFTKGKFLVNIIELPNMKVPRLLQKIPAKITMNMTTTFDTPFSLLTFPLSTLLVWNSTATNFTLNGKIESLWLNLINFLNKIATPFGYGLDPDIAALLPVIDIKDALTTIGNGNVFQTPAISDAFFCLNTENITVPAGTYEAYNITLVGGLAQCFYAPTAGNVIKINGNLEAIIPYFKGINMELLSTNYS